MSSTIDHLVKQISATEDEIKEVKDEIVAVEQKIKAVERKIDSVEQKINSCAEEIKQLISNPDPPLNTADMRDFYDGEKERFVKDKATLEAKEATLEADKRALREKEAALRASKDSLLERLYQNDGGVLEAQQNFARMNLEENVSNSGVGTDSSDLDQGGNKADDLPLSQGKKAPNSQISKISKAEMENLMKKLGLPNECCPDWNPPPGISVGDEPMDTFTWGKSSENSAEHQVLYTAYLKDFIHVQDPATLHLLVAPAALLSVSNQHVTYNGTTDVVIVPVGIGAEDDNLHTNLLGIIELKKPETMKERFGTSVAQAILVHFLAMMQSTKVGVLTCLTDLRETWIFFWLSNDATRLYKLPTGAASARFLLHNMLHSTEDHGDFPTDFCNRGTWENYEARTGAGTMRANNAGGNTWERYEATTGPGIVRANDGEDNTEPEGDDGDANTNREEDKPNDVDDAADDMNKSRRERDNNETSQQRDNTETRPGEHDGKQASKSVAHASGRPDVENVSRPGTDKSMKDKSEHAQGKVIQRDSDNWAARMKVLDTGADVANELDLLEMLDDEQDRKDIVESVMFRNLVMHLFPGIHKIRDDDEPNDDGSLVLTTANLERHLKSSGEESNYTHRWLRKSNEHRRNISA